MVFSRTVMTWWFHAKRGSRRWITSIVAVQVLTVMAFYHSMSGSNAPGTYTHYETIRSRFAQTNNSTFNEYLQITLDDDDRSYFQPVGLAQLCYLEGTDIQATLKSGTTQCQCRPDYYGRECGIPASVWHRTIAKKYHRWPLKPRKVPRRIIHGLNINHEIDFFQVRLEELQDAVDAYIVCESNYTAHGDAKPLHLLDKLRSGFMEPFQSRIIHVPLFRFPPQGRKNGWFIDMYLRTYMGVYGLARIDGVRPDDLFVLLDADEIPTREVLMFLKLYDGYPEPVRLAMRWSVFGFFWKRKKEKQSDSILNWIFDVVSEEKEYDEDLLEISAVSTMEMVWKVCHNNTFLIRKDMSGYDDFQERLSQYRSSGHRVSPWTAGTRDHYAGHHCSWCFTPEGIRTKLLSAHADDKPRWGDFSNKTDINFIANLIRKGEWFDGSRPLLVANFAKERQYAPNYMLQHPNNYSHLLYPPDISHQPLKNV